MAGTSSDAGRGAGDLMDEGMAGRYRDLVGEGELLV
jgi:hypothetical protein